MMTRQLTLAAALLLTAAPLSAQSADPGYLCTVEGGRPGAVQRDGSTGPFRRDGIEYVGRGDTARAAAEAAVSNCSLAGPLGAEGCGLLTCFELGGAAVPAPDLQTLTARP